jgi:hypothetical protein
MQFSLKKLEKYVSGILPHYGSVKIVPRSLPTYIDKILPGEVRFSLKSGNNIATIEPDVTIKLSEDALVLQRSLSFNSVSKWFVPGSVVYFDLDYETCTIEDVSYDDNIIVFNDGINSVHRAGSSIVLQAVPIVLNSSSSYLSKQIVVDSTYFFTIGDQIAIELISGLYSSAVVYNVEESTYNVSNSTYTLILDKPINRSVSAGETVYLKANPAYSSNIILIPTGNYSVNRNGPFLIDYLSGRIGEGDSIDEFLSVQIFDQFGASIYGTTYTPQIMNKNYVVQSSNIRSDAILFWDLIEGSLQYSKNEFSIMIPNSSGKFSCFKDFIPVLPKGKEWTITLKPNNAVDFQCKFHSYTGESQIFLNEKFNNFMYDYLTGLITYTNPIDLSSVAAGYTFIDSSCNDHLILSVDEVNYTIRIGQNLDVDFTSPINTLHGSIRSGNPRRFFKLAAGVNTNIIIGSSSIETDSDRVELSFSPSYIVENENLISFSYDILTGLIQYESYIDLSSVEVGQYFVDSLGNNFKISGKNTSNYTLQLDIGLSLKYYTVTRSEQGSIISDYSVLQVEMSEWSLNSPLAFSLSYNILAITKSNWMSTGLILKNMFNSLDDISAKYDSHQSYNGGTIKL